jgi:CheY-like chemotaxis protein
MESRYILNEFGLTFGGKVAIKKHTHNEILGIIFATSNHQVNVERTLAMGAKMFLTKPSDFNALKNKLKSIIQTFAIMR